MNFSDFFKQPFHAILYCREVYQYYFNKKYRVKADFINYSHICATKKSLLLLNNNKFTKLLRGHFYGITMNAQFIYVFQSFPKLCKGRILKISPNGSVMSLIENLSEGCHQIDIRENNLFIVDTYNNKILQYNLDNLSENKVFFPLGPLLDGRQSINYQHMNSILLGKENNLILCHNEFIKTGKFSEILVCDKSFKVIKQIKINSKCAHNIGLTSRKRYLFCNSLENSISNERYDEVQLSSFTRGLSITEDCIVVGESDYGKRDIRDRLNGWINFFDHKLVLINRMRVPGLVQEIRALHDIDLTLSKHNHELPDLIETKIH